MVIRHARWTRQLPPGGAVILALGASLASCCASDRHRRVSATEFLNLARQPTGSAFHTSFIGATDARAYLSVWSARLSSLGGEDVYSCALSDLPPGIAEAIQAGRNPWSR